MTWKFPALALALVQVQVQGIGQRKVMLTGYHTIMIT